MPTLDTKPVVGAGGGIYVAPYPTPQPANFAALAAAPWSYLGLISDDGVSYTPLDEDTEDMNVWQMAFPWDIVTTGQASSISAALAQWNRHTVEFLFNGGTWDDTEATTTTFTPPAMGETEDWAVFLNVLTSSAHNVGVFYRHAKVTEREDTTFNKGEMSTLGVTVTMLGTENAAPQVLYFDKAGMAVAP
ncbi:hypothetical protein AB0P21_09760 [Kribbella sp. NPDC056861]|uniref:phage tail tube protein n=1 Tax=Kribbella sp. NPDC056861 TaxID=3154857 RepID=UPI003422CD0B